MAGLAFHNWLNLERGVWLMSPLLAYIYSFKFKMNKMKKKLELENVSSSWVSKGIKYMLSWYV